MKVPLGGPILWWATEEVESAQNGQSLLLTLEVYNTAISACTRQEQWQAAVALAEVGVVGGTEGAGICGMQAIQTSTFRTCSDII